MEKTVTLGLNEYQELVRVRSKYYELQRTDIEKDNESVRKTANHLEDMKVAGAIITPKEDFEAKWHQSETNCKLLQKTIERLEKERLEICKDYQNQIIDLEKEVNNLLSVPLYDQVVKAQTKCMKLELKIAELEHANNELNIELNHRVSISIPEYRELLKDKERLDWLIEYTGFISRDYLDSLKNEEVSK